MQICILFKGKKSASFVMNVFLAFYAACWFFTEKKVIHTKNALITTNDVGIPLNFQTFFIYIL